jgi:hypothetical protein
MGRVPRDQRPDPPGRFAAYLQFTKFQADRVVFSSFDLPHDELYVYMPKPPTEILPI